MKLKKLAFRGDGYFFQLIHFSNLLYSPFDNEFKEKLGFSYSVCENLIVNIYKKYLLKQINIFNICRNLWFSMLKLEPSINISFLRRKVFRIYKDDLYFIYGHSEVDNILNFLSIKIGDTTVLPTGIDDFNPLYEKPFIDFGEYIYLALPQVSMQNLPKLFHYSFVAGKIFDKVTEEKYKKSRGKIVEDVVCNYLGKYFSPAEIFQGLKYPPSTKIYESDITMQDDLLSIFCECKSKILTLPTLNGDKEALINDFNQAIGIAYKQALRTIKRVNQKQDFISEETGEIIRLKNTKYKFVFCIMPENFGVVPFEVQNFMELDQEIPIVPIIMNIYDLEIVTIECKTKEELLEYLLFRLNNYQLVSAIDELDYLGLYQDNGNVKIDVDAIKMYVVDFTAKINKKYNVKDLNWLMKYPLIP